MSNPKNNGIGDSGKEVETNLKIDTPDEAIMAGLSHDEIGSNAKTNEQINDALNPKNFSGTMNPQDLKDDNASNQRGYSSGDNAAAAIKQYNDALSGAGEGRIAGTIFEHSQHVKKEEEEKNKRHAYISLGINDNYEQLKNALDDLADKLNESSEALDDATSSATLTIYELEEQRNEINSLLRRQQQELEELRNGTSTLLQGEDPESEMGRAQIALKEAEIRNTESRLRLVDATIERASRQIQEAQDFKDQTIKEIEDLRSQLEEARQDGNEEAISELQTKISAAETTIRDLDTQIDNLRESSRLNLAIRDLSMEAKAESGTCGADSSVEMEKVAQINASTALLEKLNAMTSDGKLSQSELEDLKASFESAGISNAAQQSFINAYVETGGAVSSGKSGGNSEEIYLKGDEAKAAFMAKLDLAIAETKADIAANQDTIKQADEVLASSSERDLELANASVDTANNMSRVIDVIRDGDREIYVDRGENGEADTYYYLNDDGTKNKYDPSNPEDAAKIARFEAESNPPQFSRVSPLTSSFNAALGIQTAASSPILASSLQVTPIIAKRFANEDISSNAYEATAQRDLASDALVGDTSRLENLKQIKEKVSSGEMSVPEDQNAVISGQAQGTTDSASASSDGWSGQDGMELKTSEEMQIALQDVYQKIENGNISREDLDQVLGADASPELKQQIEAALERDGIEIQEPDSPKSTSDVGISARSDVNSVVVSHPLIGIGPFEVPAIQPPQVSSPDNGILPATEYTSFADSMEFAKTNPKYVKGYEPTYVGTINNGTENVPAAGENFALAQTIQTKQSAPSVQSNVGAEDIIRMQREAEIRMAENNTGPANNQGGGIGGAL